MALLGVLSVLFGIGVIFNLAQASVSWANVGAGGFLAFASLSAFAFVWRRDQEERAFLHRVRERLGHGSVEQGGASIDEDTEIVRHRIVVSFLVVTLEEEVASTDPSRVRLTGVLCSLIAFLFGWWALPWGPVKTVGAIATNLRGGRRMTLREHTLARQAEEED